MDVCIEMYTDKYQTQVKNLVKKIHEEFGFPYDFYLDYDLEDPGRFYSQAGGAFYILLDGEKVVGTAAVKKADDKKAELKRMYLLTEYRRRNFGTLLLEYALGFCRKQGFRVCGLDMHRKQSAAYMFYRKFGFETYEEVGNAIYMAKEL